MRLRSQSSTIEMVFSVRQLQEKCREQNQPLHLVDIDLTKAFDLVSRDSLFYRTLPLIGCPPKLLSTVKSFHDVMSTVQFDGDLSDEFGVKSGVKQGCVLCAGSLDCHHYRDMLFADDAAFSFWHHTQKMDLNDSYSQTPVISLVSRLA